MDILHQWQQHILESKSFNLADKLIIEGLFKHQSGGRIQYAKVVFEIKPNPHFDVDLAPFLNVNDETKGYMEWAIFGLLDQLLVISIEPLRNIYVSIKTIDIHPVHSSKAAFRFAGRDAGQKIPFTMRRF